MFLVKVQYWAYKSPRWVIVDENCPEYPKAFQKSRKTATRFATREAAENVASHIYAGIRSQRDVSIVPFF